MARQKGMLRIEGPVAEYSFHKSRASSHNERSGRRISFTEACLASLKQHHALTETREALIMKQVLNRRKFLRLATAAGAMFLPFSSPGYSLAAAPNDRLLKYIRESMGKTLRPASDIDPSGKSIPLPNPFNVPCISDHFQNLFYYDTYFLNRGLIALGDIQQAQNNVNDVLFLVDRLGFVPNSNRLDMTNRSQPPYLCMMVKDIYEATGNKEWLKTAYPLIGKEYEFWITKRGTTY